MSETWKPIPWPKVDELDRAALCEELGQTRTAHSKNIDELIQAEQRIQQLKHLREIAIDVEACLKPGEPVPEFMRLAFADAITSTGEAPEKEE